MTKKELFDIFDSISKSYPDDSLRQVWEIFCHEYDIDFDLEGYESEVFDDWLDEFNKKVELILK